VALQSLTTMAADFGGISESDTVLIVVPMFHGNAWNHPYASALAGATPVLPYSDIQPESLLELIESEGVTTTGGVPTVWHDVLGVLDRDPRRFDLSSLRLLRIGGSAVSESLLHGLEERHGVPIAVGFGMTEIGPMGGLWNAKDAQRIVAGTALPPRTMTGRPAPFLEVRARRDGVELPWDGESVGELEYRGASVSDGYWNVAGADNFTEDGWLRSGDLGTIGSQGVIQIHDRAKDMVKSGGEWISSVALEEALVMHPGVAEAAVVAIPHPRWQERPLAVVVVEPGQAVTSEQLLEHLARHVPRWWLPDRFEVVDEIPRSPAGKILKRNLRDRFSEA
jgi:fatty-acyl-CoA synthase